MANDQRTRAALLLWPDWIYIQSDQSNNTTRARTPIQDLAIEATQGTPQEDIGPEYSHQRSGEDGGHILDTPDEMRDTACWGYDSWLMGYAGGGN